MSSLRTHHNIATALVEDMALPRYRFHAWRLAEGQAEAIELAISAASLVEALQAACAGASHKDRLIIREIDTVADRAVVHFYIIKREAKGIWRSDPTTAIPYKWHRQYPELFMSLAVTDFAPVVPWSWSPGADVVGAGPRVVEARRG